MTKSSLNYFLHPNGKMLGTLLARLNQLNQWNAWLKENLNHDQPLTKHCYVVNLIGSSLIVIADSPHWVTRLRFHIPELLKKLKQYPEFANLRAICCKTQPNHHLGGSQKTKRAPQKLSTKSVTTLQESAKKISDNKLRAILEKIAQNSEDN